MCISCREQHGIVEKDDAEEAQLKQRKKKKKKRERKNKQKRRSAIYIVFVKETKNTDAQDHCAFDVYGGRTRASKQRSVPHIRR